MTTNVPDKISLEIKRVIKAPRDRVYAAWTDPAQLREWGKFRWELTNCDGEEMTMRGEYRELQPGKKIVFTWQWEDDEDWKQRDSVVTVELSDCDGGTEVRLTHEQLPSEESRDRHTEGWKSVLNKLERFCRD